MSGEQAAEPIQVSITANIQGLLDGLKNATAAVKGGTDKMGSALTSMGNVVNAVKGPLLAITGILAGGKMFKDAIHATIEWNMEANKLSKVLNVTVQQASVYAVAMHTLGISTDTMVGAVARLQMRVAAGGQAFEKWGVAIKNSHGGALPMNKAIENMAEKYNALGTQQEKNAMLTQLAGRGWLSMLGIMRLTAERMAEAKKEAEELHLIVGPEGVAKTREYQESLRKLSLIGTSLQVQLGNALMPTLTTLGTWLGKTGPSMAQGFAYTLKGLAQIFYALKAAIEVVAISIGAFFFDLIDGIVSVGKAAWMAVKGDFKGAGAEISAAAQRSKDQWAAAGDGIKEVWANLKQDSADLWEEKPVSQGKEGPEAGPDKTKGESPLGAWEKELEKKKALLAESDGDLAEMSKADERKFWAEKLAQTKKGSEDWVKIRLKMAADGKATQKEIDEAEEKARKERQKAEEEAAAERRALAKLEKEDKISAAREGLAAQREALEHDLAMGKINHAQKIQAEKNFRAQELAIERKALADEQALYQKGSSEWQKLENKKVDAARKAENDIRKLENQAQEQRLEKWKGFLGSMTGGFDSAVKGLIKGTMTWGDAFKEILNQALDGLISFFVQWGIQEAIKWAASLALGTTSRVAEATGAAAVYAVNSMASVAAIPVVGWAMAPAVGAASYAEGLAMAGLASAAGGWDRVPSDQLAQIHKNEMVMSAPLAEGLRGIIANGQAGGTQRGGDTYIIKANDAKSFMDMFKRNATGIMKHTNELARNGRKS